MPKNEAANKTRMANMTAKTISAGRTDASLRRVNTIATSIRRVKRSSSIKTTSRICAIHTDNGRLMVFIRILGALETTQLLIGAGPTQPRPHLTQPRPHLLALLWADGILRLALRLFV